MAEARLCKDHIARKIPMSVARGHGRGARDAKTLPPLRIRRKSPYSRTAVVPRRTAGNQVRYALRLSQLIIPMRSSHCPG